MSNWFDGIAKRAARRAPAASTSVESPAADDAGLSRRQVLARGAVITGVAWTAPALLAARPAFAGASICIDTSVGGVPTPNQVPCGDGTFKCCPDGESCVMNKRGTFECGVAPGDPCNNRGNGQCNGGMSRCDQPSNTDRFGICGGNGTICTDGSQCEFGSCGTDGRCGGLGALCPDGDVNCAPFDANDKIPFKCSTSGSTTGTCQPV